MPMHAERERDSERERGRGRGGEERGGRERGGERASIIQHNLCTCTCIHVAIVHVMENNHFIIVITTDLHHVSQNRDCYTSY